MIRIGLKKMAGMICAISVALSSCTKDSGPIVIPPPVNDTVSFSNHVMVIMQAKCWFCHPTSGNLDLGHDMAYDQLVNVLSVGYAPSLRVAPYDTAGSVLYQKVIGNQDFGIEMPPGNSATLTEEEKRVFQKWILQGALNN